MNTAIEHLSKHISSDTSGILWLTDSPLDYKTSGVYEFNYLLDGILLKRITQNKNLEVENKKSNFFLGQNFGRPLFISHVVINEKRDIDIMYQHIKTALPLIAENSKIHIYNRSKNTANINILKEVSQKFIGHTFQNLNI